MRSVAATTRPDWGHLYGIAEAQAGYFTTAQAAEAGFSTPLIAHHLRAGTIQRARRGVYRLTRFPASGHEHLVVYWLWAARAGVFSHETALLLHGLSDVLPDVAHLTVPSAWQSRRLRVPSGLRLHFADLTPDDRAWFDGLPITTAHRTVLDFAADHGDPDLLKQAIEDGVRRGLFTRAEIASALRRPSQP